MVNIGEMGIILLLRAANKFAPVEEFSKQLCHHISSTKPQTIGTFKPRNAKQKLGLERSNSIMPHQLIQQMFTMDNSMTVGEAATKSFVEVVDFVMFG